ncbi:MAG: molybdenum cofactor biosynthesis protein MoaE [Myxococcota bacterium]|nr:molybdenum cofactor biosynthesis protein MoaE [Myxococcota bacterium]
MFLLQKEVLDPSPLRRAVSDPGHGALLLFEGVTRDHFEGRRVTHLEYEAYAAMALLEMERIAADALLKWPTVKIAIAHRTGPVGLGETSLIVAVGAPHRPEGYEANRFVLEAIKKRLPVWKKEVYEDGQEWKANA